MVAGLDLEGRCWNSMCPNGLLFRVVEANPQHFQVANPGFRPQADLQMGAAGNLVIIVRNL